MISEGIVLVLFCESRDHLGIRTKRAKECPLMWKHTAQEKINMFKKCGGLSLNQIQLK